MQTIWLWSNWRLRSAGTPLNIRFDIAAISLFDKSLKKGKTMKIFVFGEWGVIKQSFTYTLTKLDMLASKLSGSVLILLLFNRLRKRRKEQEKQSFNHQPRKILLLTCFWQSIEYEIYCNFRQWKRKGTKLINSDGISIWGFFLIFYLRYKDFFTEIIIRGDIFWHCTREINYEMSVKFLTFFCSFFGIRDEFLWHFNTHSRSKATRSANASFSIVCKWLSVNCLRE